MYVFNKVVYDCHLTEDDVFSDEILSIKGEKFKEFIDLCSSHAAFFSLTRAPWTQSTDANLETELQPHLITTLKCTKWFCYHVTEKNMLEISIYRATSESIEIILQHLSNLFVDEHHGACPHEPRPTLEDLCFFGTEKLFMGTVSHEYICHVFPPDKDFEQALPQFGKWSWHEDVINEQIFLADYIKL